MRRTTLMVDDDLMRHARKALGTKGIKDTIDRALQQAIAAEAGRRFLDRLRQMQDLDLDDPEVMRGAWRE
jgi:Arc/MetJ family transcription regulator